MNTTIFFLITLELLIVAIIDLKKKKISNYWVLGNILLALLFHLMLANYYPWSWETLIFPVGFILVGFLLFLCQIMGAGDSKFLASLFLVIPLELHLVYLGKLMTATILVGGILLFFKIMKNFTTLRAYFLNRHWLGIRDVIKSHFSYAPVILLAWIMLGVEKWF